MAQKRTIESPGVEFREIDLSLTSNLPIGTNILATGFAQQGPTDEIINVTSISEYDQIFGLPTNAAERYLYHTAKQVLQSPGNLLVTRLPYGSGEGIGYANDYSALVYPIAPYTAAVTGTIGTTFAAASAYYLGEPIHVRLTADEYTDVINNNIDWTNIAGSITYAPSADIGNAGLIVINEAKTVIDDTFSGYYIAIADNTTINPATGFTAVTGLQTVNAANTFTAVPSSRLTFNLSQPASGIAGSTSEIIEGVPNYDFNTTAYNDSIILAVFKIRQSLYADDPNKLDQVLTEAYVGSFNETRKVSTSGGGAPQSFFIEEIINKQSPNIKVLVNPNLAKTAWTAPGVPDKIVRVLTHDTPAGADRTRVLTAGYMKDAGNLYALGVYTPNSMRESKDIGNVVAKLERSLILVDNDEIHPIDITVEGGLGTIWATAVANETELGLGGDNSYIFDDTVFVDTDDLTVTTGAAPTGDLFSAYTTVFNTFNTFAALTRRDHMFIADPLRQLFVNGPDSKVASTRGFIFSRDIYWGLRNLYATANSSYAAVYGNWGKVYDPATDKYCWMPFSGFAAKRMATNDANGFPWTPPGGLTNGLIDGIVELAITPTQKQRDLLYRAGINPVAFFPSDGFAIMGQKTLLRRPSAFDRINVRRLFLELEKATQKTLRYFVMQPNTIFTRTRLRNTIAPIFSLAKNNEGLYDYLIVCDERNNSADVIDRNELIVDIYLKAVRAGEFILVNFIATRTSQNFSELV